MVDRIVEISCEHVWREISNYLDNAVGPTLRARMEAHFRQCAHCKAVLDGTGNILRLVAGGESFDLPAGFSGRLKQHLQKTVGKDRK